MPAHNFSLTRRHGELPIEGTHEKVIEGLWGAHAQARDKGDYKAQASILGQIAKLTGTDPAGAGASQPGSGPQAPDIVHQAD